MSQDSHERMQYLRESVEARRREDQRVLDIKEQITALQFILEEKARFSQYLNSIKSVKFVGYYDLETYLGGSDNLFWRLRDDDLIATSRIRTPFYNREFLSQAPADQLEGAWLKLCLKRFGIDNDYYLVFGRHMAMIGWARINVSDDGDWLKQIFDDVQDARDAQFMILSSDLQRVFALFSWEQDYRVQIRQLSQLDNIKRAFQHEP